MLRPDPAERPRLVVPGTGGPHPLVQGLLGPTAVVLTHTSYLAVTDRSVSVLRGPRPTGEPEEALAAVPPEQAGALVAKPPTAAHGRRRSRVRLRLPQAERPVRMEVRFTSRPQPDAFPAEF
ncbi:hypothetical protein [Kitasatospora sp. NRRL B-11411]|uniref:hypothetical protein n=1 Tax=Kitasatospora sp. NRRL B-11411 TaxID=1463822 RepID=UPI0004C2DE3C|nr:hypothetical protein [Kitasatospora sp. NRRL B-11411]